MDLFKGDNETISFVGEDANLSINGELGFFSFWILATGSWEDSGIWIDEEVWNDG